MDDTKLLELIKQVLDQTVQKEINNFKKDINKNNLRIDELETKLGMIYDELARTKEDITNIM